MDGWHGMVFSSFFFILVSTGSFGTSSNIRPSSRYPYFAQNSAPIVTQPKSKNSIMFNLYPTINLYTLPTPIYRHVHFFSLLFFILRVFDVRLLIFIECGSFCILTKQCHVMTLLSCTDFSSSRPIFGPSVCALCCMLCVCTRARAPAKYDECYACFRT